MEDLTRVGKETVCSLHMLICPISVPCLLDCTMLQLLHHILLVPCCDHTWEAIAKCPVLAASSAKHQVQRIISMSASHSDSCAEGNGPELQGKKLEAEVLAPMQRWTSAYTAVLVCSYPCHACGSGSSHAGRDCIVQHVISCLLLIDSGGMICRICNLLVLAHPKIAVIQEGHGRHLLMTSWLLLRHCCQWPRFLAGLRLMHVAMQGAMQLAATNGHLASYDTADPSLCNLAGAHEAAGGRCGWRWTAGGGRLPS